MTFLTILQPDKTQLIPLIFAFKDRIEKHIIIYDEARDDARLANELANGIEAMNHHYSLNTPVEKISIDEDSHPDMIAVQQRLEKEKIGSLYLNAAGADTALLVILSGFVLDNGGKVLAYDKNDNSYNIITKEGFANHPVNSNMMLKDFLMLLDERVIEECSKEDIHRNHDALMTLFGDAKLMFKVRKLLSKREIGEIGNSYPAILKALEKLDIIDHTHHFKDSTKFSKFGIHFEEFIYLHLKRFDFDDIKVGVKIVFESASEKDGIAVEVSNEFDILTIKNNRIGFVECKIGDNLNPQATVYKSDALMDYFGDDSRCLIVNIQPNATPHMANSKINFSKNLTLRANRKRIEIFNAFDLGEKKFGQEVRKVFGVTKQKK